MTRATPAAAKPKRSKVKRTAVAHDPEIGYIMQKGQGKVVEAFDYLTGSSIEPIDKERYAMRPGKRISKKYRDPRQANGMAGTSITSYGRTVQI